MPLLANRSARSAHFQAELTAQVTHTVLAGGKTTEIWTYNGQLPGPQIVVQEGDTVEIRFRNALPQPTTIHWHGLDVPAQADGNPQDPVPPGGQRVYRFTLPEGSAGTYWYHPHPHKHVSEQVYRGLAGTLIVRAKDDPLAGRPEQHWLISDLRLAADGSIPPNTPTDWMNGREGEFVLINGQYRPDIRVQETSASASGTPPAPVTCVCRYPASHGSWWAATADCWNNRCLRSANCFWRPPNGWK